MVAMFFLPNFILFWSCNLPPLFFIINLW